MVLESNGYGVIRAAARSAKAFVDIERGVRVWGKGVLGGGGGVGGLCVCIYVFFCSC
jgi:hypothetical protein